MASGLFIRLFRHDHPHIVYPIYIITGVLSVIAGFVISLIVSLVGVIFKGPNIYEALIICGISSLIINIALIIRIIKKTK
jgi:hypothetical protein